MTTVLIAGGGTGGHLIPALAIADAVRAGHPEWEVVLVGARRGIESRLLPGRGYRHYLLGAEPIYRRQWWRNLKWSVVALRLAREIRRVLDRERPALVVGTGGYAAGPVLWLAGARGIPTATLEPNARPGLATRWLARRVKQVYLGHAETRTLLTPGPGTEVLLTGTPIVAPDPGARSRGLLRYGLDPARPTVLVTGGSQGARALNEVVAAWVRSGRTAGLQLIWSTGALTRERYQSLHAPPGVQVAEFLDPIAEAYAVADLAVTRAGMLTLSELCAWGIPSLLVPLPSAAANHQAQNAGLLASAGAALLVPEAELTPDRLAREVEGLLADPARRARLATAAKVRGRPDALKDILGAMERLIPGG